MYYAVLLNEEQWKEMVFSIWPSYFASKYTETSNTSRNHNDIDMVEKAPISYQLGGSQDYVRAEVTYFPALELCIGMVGVLSKKMRSLKATNKVVRFN